MVPFFVFISVWSTISRDHQVGFFDCLSFFTRTEESSDSSRSNSPAPANEGKIEFITEFGGENSDAPEVKGSDKTTVTNKHSRSVYTIRYFKSFIYQRVLRPFWQDYGWQFYTTLTVLKDTIFLVSKFIERIKWYHFWS